MKRTAVLSVFCVVFVAAGACRTATEEGAAASGASLEQSAEQVKPVPAELPDVLARVNGEDVKRSDLDMLIRNIELGKGPIPPGQRNEVLRAALDRLITYTVLQQEARSRNITVPETDVNERVQEMQAQFPNEEAFRKALADRSMSLERLRSDARTDMVIARMMDAEVAQTPAATEEDVREFYATNPDKFRREESVRASHILILVDEKADEGTKQKARAEIEAVLKRARKGEDFGALAKAHSQDGSAAEGGDLNYFSRGQMVPPFEQAAFSLQPGQISDVVTTQFGYHVIKMTDRQPGSVVPLEDVSERVREFLTEQHRQERADAFVNSLKEKSRIEVLI